MPKKLEGLFTALITPFKDDLSVDYSAFEKIIAFQLESGANGIVVAGTTGETSTMSHTEHSDLIAFAIKTARSIKPSSTIIACTGSNSTSEAVGLTRRAEDDGADFSLITAPYYNKGNREGMLSHFCTISQNSSIPLIIYNVPARTVVDIPDDLIAELRSKDKSFVAVKDATGCLLRVSNLRSMVDDEFTLISGDDHTAHIFNLCGGSGVISAVSNIAPTLVYSIESESRKETVDKLKIIELQKKLSPLLDLISLDVNPIPVKYAASVLGMCRPIFRLPLCPPNKECQERITSLLKAGGLK